MDCNRCYCWNIFHHSDYCLGNLAVSFLCIFPGSMRIQPSLVASVRADHLTLDGGGERVGDFEKFLQALVGRKKLRAAQM